MIGKIEVSWDWFKHPNRTWNEIAFGNFGLDKFEVVHHMNSGLSTF